LDQLPFIVAGGGIGGLKVALVLARQGHAVQVLEHADAFGEIGAVIQLGPNVFRMFEHQGLTQPIREVAYFPPNLVMRDVRSGELVVRSPVGAQASMPQYLAQGVCIAIEGAVTLGAALCATPHDIAAAFRRYQQARYLRTGRLQLTARLYGEIYHASGVMRELRNRMFQSGGEAAGFIGTHWLYQGIDPDRPCA